MAVKTEGLESELIESVCGAARDRVAADEIGPFEAFVRQYYRWVAPEDLANRSAHDLCATALAHWALAQQREQNQDKVRVFNPTEDVDGYRLPFTVVDIVSDDMPFVVDSVTMELNRQGYSINLVIHPVMGVRRDDEGQVLEVLEPGGDEPDVSIESILHAEVTHEDDPGQRDRLRTEIERVLSDVTAAVRDWGAMRERTQALIRELQEDPPPIDRAELEEGEELLRWLADDHFTFLGYREYELTDQGGEVGLQVVEGSGLGILRKRPKRSFTKLGPRALELARSPHLLVVTKANSRATVHRPAYLDYIGVRRYEGGEVVGERRFLGLFTHYAYRESPLQIPMLRGKVKRVLDRAGFAPESHDAKALMEILEAYPRDSLFQIETDKLFEIAMGILALGERQRLRLFVRQDPLDRFVSCLVCLPRDRFNTQNRERIGRILTEEFHGTHVDWALHLSESVLVRIHYVVHCPRGIPADYDVSATEQRLVRAVRAWTDDLRVALTEELGAEKAQSVYRRYDSAFPPGYRDAHTARTAVSDTAKLEELRRSGGPIIHLYRASDEEDDADPSAVRCKLFSTEDVALSDILPIFEHMGAKVVDEHPHEIRPRESEPVWLYDFGLRVQSEDVERIRDLFQETFLWVWRGEIEDDGLNGLVLAASLAGRRISVLRSVARYLRQASIPYSDAYMVRTLLRHPDVAAMLVELFCARFDPEQHDEESAQSLREQIERAIDAVESLDEDRILRSFLSVLLAILRTNFFRPGRTSLSFKVDPTRIPLLPLPRPRFEIFVFSPRVEGVHLRGGKVARGGIRWSDRPEDFRTEILGLMKAQMVKNALIVPVGSKGGFVVKRPPAEGGREALQDEAIECYKVFLAGLLDLTDNIVNGKVKPPERVVRYDDDDTYLVVAADKGTASFSDVANDVAADYDFWLGDAFASGGSRGYDHKAIGITARGAWESVKRHFRELGIDIQATDFTAVGIGDMSGDVFGNGMLLSRHIKLLAAFNHAHIFLDPNPDPEASYKERERLFKLGRSSWSDYSDDAISDGGGVYLRSVKSIYISDQVKAALAIEEDSLSPPDLIAALLRARVDLLFNGGIGTYVKSTGESHEDVGDKANDALRVDGREVRCQVVGEGGNLGFTQLGRVEYASSGAEGQGGRINTDAIDNAGGVALSDHEVNIKILLGQLISAGELSRDERNHLLAEMTNAVADCVLYANYTQTQSLSLALDQAESMVDIHARLLHYLEQVAGLDRELEFLPGDEEIADRKAAHAGFLSPELAVMMAYCKIQLYSDLVESDLPDDPYLRHDLERYFPPPLPERYSAQMHNHRLRREIIATVVANQLVDRAGTTFAFRVGEEVGASAALLARGYAVAREVFEMRSFWEQIEALDNKVDAQVQLEMLLDGRRLVERATRWLARGHAPAIEIEKTTRRFQDGARLLERSLPDLLDANDRETFDARVTHFAEAGVPRELAVRVAGMPALRSVLDIVEISEATGRSLEAVMQTYFALGSNFVLTWLRDRIIELPRANRWQVLARAALRDDLYSLHRALAEEVLEAAGDEAPPEEAIAAWRERNEAAVERVTRMLYDIRATRTYDKTTLPVALRARTPAGEGLPPPVDAGGAAR
ncbi:MAG: NAD-glutamate dehydrogenase [Solirubrobacteraceae bacterium]